MGFYLLPMHGFKLSLPMLTSPRLPVPPPSSIFNPYSHPPIPNARSKFLVNLRRHRCSSELRTSMTNHIFDEKLDELKYECGKKWNRLKFNLITDRQEKKNRGSSEEGILKVRTGKIAIKMIFYRLNPLQLAHHRAVYSPYQLATMLGFFF